jgi:hypothetical protein
VVMFQRKTLGRFGRSRGRAHAESSYSSAVPTHFQADRSTPVTIEAEPQREHPGARILENHLA